MAALETNVLLRERMVLLLWPQLLLVVIVVRWLGMHIDKRKNVRSMLFVVLVILVAAFVV
jgi:hypothetical protein